MARKGFGIRVELKFEQELVRRCYCSLYGSRISAYIILSIECSKNSRILRIWNAGYGECIERAALKQYQGWGWRGGERAVARAIYGRENALASRIPRSRFRLWESRIEARATCKMSHLKKDNRKFQVNDMPLHRYRLWKSRIKHEVFVEHQT